MAESSQLPTFSNGTTCYNAPSIVVICTATVSIYNALELLLLIFTSFRSYTGLYFWSLFLTTLGVIPYNIGFLGSYFDLMVDWASYVLDSFGWILMVTGESVVLYSRLHLVVQNARVLKWVKWMIIIDAIVLHIPTTVVLFASTYGSEQATATAAWTHLERVQMTLFCTQEFIISGIYVYETIRLLKLVSMGASTRRTMWQLFSINVIIILLDIALLAVEYKNMLNYERTFKGVVYSIKLKLEFAILNKLVQLVGGGAQGNRVLQQADRVLCDEKSNGGGSGRDNSTASPAPLASTTMNPNDVLGKRTRMRTKSAVSDDSRNSTRFGWGRSPKRENSDLIEVQHIEKVISGSTMVDPESHHRGYVQEEGDSAAIGGSAGRGMDDQLEQYRQSIHHKQSPRTADAPDSDSLYDYADAVRQISRP